jgi:hypothetical protein
MQIRAAVTVIRVQGLISAEKYRQPDVEASSRKPINISISYEVENIINLTLITRAHRIATCTA